MIFEKYFKMKKLNIILNAIVLIASIVIQIFIFIGSYKRWYGYLYYYLNALQFFVFIFILLSISIMILKKKKIINIYTFFTYIGFLISIHQYMDFLGRCDSPVGLSDLNFFIFTPLICCLFISLTLYIYNRKRKLPISCHS